MRPPAVPPEPSKLIPHVTHMSCQDQPVSGFRIRVATEKLSIQRVNHMSYHSTRRSTLFYMGVLHNLSIRSIDRARKTYDNTTTTSRDSEWLQAGRPRGRSSSPGRVKNFIHVDQTVSGVHPTSYTMGTVGFFPGVMRPGREADHSPPTSAEVKKVWIYTSTPPYSFMAYCLISYAHGQFYLFTFYCDEVKV
jgi:hypothetical protein